MGTISDSYEQTRLSFLFFFFQYRLTSFYCTSQILHFFFFFLQIEVLWQLSVKKVGPVFQLSNSVCSLHISVKRFDNSHNISNPPPSKRLQLAEGSGDD